MTEFKAILMDPPWLERGGGKIKRGADRHYPLMSFDEIVQTVYQSGIFNPASDCHLYMWVTNNHLKDGLKLMEALGFRYITNLVWVKNSFGLGQYFRGQHELCLFGVKGRLLGNSRNTSTVIHSDKTRHSEKPVSIYDLIECVSPPPYLEMFARERDIGSGEVGSMG